jgi:hypothetical protein
MSGEAVGWLRPPESVHPHMSAACAAKKSNSPSDLSAFRGKPHTVR